MQPRKSSSIEPRRQHNMIPILPPPVPSASPRMYPPPPTITSNPQSSTSASGGFQREIGNSSGSRPHSPPWISDRPNTSTRTFDPIGRLDRGPPPTSRELWAPSMTGIYSGPSELRPTSSRWSPTRPDTSSSDIPPRLPPLSLPDYNRSSSSMWDPYESTRFSGTETRAGGVRPPSPRRPTRGPDFHREREKERERERSRSPKLARGARAGPSRSSQLASSPADKGNSTSTDPPKKKKRRLALSCAECAKRKQKCNRETPCQHCVARRVPELCVPFTRGSPPTTARTSAIASAIASPSRADRPGSGSTESATVPPSTARPQTGQLPTLSVRVGRIEALVNAMVNRVDGLDATKALSDWRINHAAALSPPPRMDHFRDFTEVSTNRSPSKSMMEDAITSDVGENALDLEEEDMERQERYQLDQENPSSEQISRLIKDSGVSTERIDQLISDLPGKKLANELVTWFFSKVNHLRYPICKHLFFQSFDALYANQRVDPRSIVFLPLVFIIFSISIQLAPETLISGGDRRKSLSVKMYWNSKTAVNVSAAFVPENLQLVETRLLTGLYLILIHGRRLAEAWSELRAAITTAQAMSLHRDGSRLGFDPYMTDYRRRLWSYLIHADATYSWMMGRPLSIDMALSDTLQPSNIDLEKLRDYPETTPEPMTQPTFATYLILRREVALIIADIARHFQKLRGHTPYQDVENLDAQLRQFADNLPPAYRMENPDRSQDHEHWWLIHHRFCIQTEYFQCLILLHRPWFLRKLDGDRYGRSREACINAALRDYKLRKEFQEVYPDLIGPLLNGSFSEFNSAMVAGISLLIEPNHPEASTLRQMLQTFVDRHETESVPDELSQREIQVIQILKRRTEDPEISRVHTVAEADSLAPTIPNIEAVDGDTKPSSSADDLTENETQRDDTGSRRGSGTPYWLSGTINLSNPDEEDHAQKLLDYWINTNGAIPLTHVRPESLKGMYSDSRGSSHFSPTISRAVEIQDHLSTQSHTEDDLETVKEGGVWGEEATEIYWNALIDSKFISMEN